MSFGIFLANLGTNAHRFSNVAPANKTSPAATVAKKALEQAFFSKDGIEYKEVFKEKPQLVNTVGCSFLHFPMLIVAGVASIFQSFIACFRD